MAPPLPIAFVLIAGVLGLAVGSFANVVIDRVPSGRSVRGRSVCDRCRRKLRWWELVPVLSACALRFRCPACRGRIAFRMTLVELGAAAVMMGSVLRFGASLHGAAAALGLTALLVLALIDLRELVVPDAVSVPAIAFVGALELLATRSWIVFLSIGAGAAFFGVQRLLSRGRWVGDGDTRVGALMGAFLPLPYLAVGIGSAYIIGGAAAGALLAARRVARGAHIPLVPFLAIGAVVATFAGDVILQWYRV